MQAGIGLMGGRIKHLKLKMDVKDASWVKVVRERLQKTEVNN